MHADKSLKSVNVISVELASWFFIITSLIVKSVDRNDAQVVCQSLGGYSGLGPRSFLVKMYFQNFFYVLIVLRRSQCYLWKGDVDALHDYFNFRFCFQIFFFKEALKKVFILGLGEAIL